MTYIIIIVLCASQIGDIPDAEIKPPDNVLFVCKLNPVTEVSAFSLIIAFIGMPTMAIALKILLH